MYLIRTCFARITKRLDFHLFKNAKGKKDAFQPIASLRTTECSLAWEMETVLLTKVCDVRAATVASRNVFLWEWTKNLFKTIAIELDIRSVPVDAINSRHASRSPDSFSHEDIRLGPSCLDSREHKHENNAVDPMLERLTTLENNLTLLLSRAEIEPYASLDDALAAPSRFHQPISVRITDPIAAPKPGMDENKMPFWRSRIIALYIDWAKSFACFRNLPHADKVALITNHASSYMIMCEAFRTPEHVDEKKLESADYGRPVPGIEGRSEMHTFFDSKLFEDSIGCQKTNRALAITEGVTVGWLPVGLQERRRDAAATGKALSFSLSGLTPVMAAMIDYVMKPFRQLNISTTEFAALQAIMFFDPDTEGIDSASQRNVAAEQKKLLTALHRHIQRNYKGSMADERYANILLRIPTIRKVAAKKNESLQMIDMLNLFALNSLVKETALGYKRVWI
ncbi:Ligand-binding domain of nuclear hormone receptor [Ancylostoma ceylanicum]|uniref:Ligand-binding domain of nuclear hormone receptor n=1 Tax=Ancylostoma ceylanicum TaxID=53326 RepID=A0A0D6LNW7_9BILA|nr:Ligand-binding domain of nuclear hormone receptor [Ancylostoma ceylanicum]